MRPRRIARSTAFIAVLTVALLGWNAGHVYAHYTEVFHGSDKAWVDSTHDHLDVQDNECDGNYVQAAGYSTTGFTIVTDDNGCTTGWGHGDGLDFTIYHICEVNVGCGGWKNT
jgi:hypothetical protein